MQRTLVFVPALVLLGAAAAQDEVEPPAPQPSHALAAAEARAAVHNKRVLVVFAAADDDVAARLKKDGALSRPLLYEFEVVQFAGADADTMAVALGLADVARQKPALLVTDAAGEALARFASGSFLADGEVRGEALLDKLKPLFCKPVDAEKKLAAGIAEAKKTGRAVFVRFDAPW